MLFWHVPAPNEALLISGSKRRKDGTEFRIVTGHGSFVIPIKQKARILSLALREAEITEECITNQGIRLNVRAVTAFKVGDDSASIANAARRFLSEQDRMEILRLHGYTEVEKMEIAKQYLVKKQLEGTGLTDKNITFTDEALTEMVRAYTREAGVRNLEREIGNVCRKVARRIVKNGPKHKEAITRENISEFLGVAKFRDSQAHEKNEVGLVTGLAWTEMGGSILSTEVQVLDGKGKPILEFTEVESGIYEAQRPGEGIFFMQNAAAAAGLFASVAKPPVSTM